MIDINTGMPEAPKGRTWTVRRFEIFDYGAPGVPGQPLVVGLTPMSPYVYELGYPVRAFNNPKSVLRAAKRSLRIREKTLTRQARKNAATSKLVGTYPPKKLGDK